MVTHKVWPRGNPCQPDSIAKLNSGSMLSSEFKVIEIKEKFQVTV